MLERVLSLNFNVFKYDKKSVFLIIMLHHLLVVNFVIFKVLFFFFLLCRWYVAVLRRLSGLKFGSEKSSCNNC